MGTKNIKRDGLIFGLFLLFSIVLFSTVKLYDHYLYKVFRVNIYLTLHLVMELTSIIMSSAIFFITYYTFEKSHNKRSVILACTFFAVSVIDVFHTLSYNGMPIFLTASSVGKATTYWIIARLCSGAGLLYASIPSEKKEIKVHKQLPLLLTILICIIVLYLVSYRQDILPKLFIEGQGLTPLKIYLEYIVMFMLFITMIITIRKYIREKLDEGYLCLIIGFMAGIFSELAFAYYTNVYDTYNLLGHLYKIISYYLLFKALFVLNVQKPYQLINEAERKVSMYADNLELLVKKRTMEIESANDKLMKNLDYARNIQSALLPTSFPKQSKLSFSSKYMPCEIIGGDFYDIYKIDENNIGILIGDVAGHGVSAAMITVFIHQNIRVKHQYDDGKIKVLTPKQVLTNLYYTYNMMSFPDEMYVVLFYGIYNLETNEMTYCSAGMNTTPLILNKSGHVKRLEISGFPICNLGAYISPSYENSMVKLEEGDVIIIYTDGLIEIDEKNPEMFTENDVIEYIRGMEDVSAEEVCEALTDAYFAIRGDRKMIDDATILVAKVSP